jgi:L-ribulose-5-phosphate 4-epimerase
MILRKLREQVLESNLELVRRGLVLYTFGNASGIDRNRGLVAIKPSGVPYDRMRPKDIVIVNLQGQIVEGNLRPSTDLPTHLILYGAFAEIGGVAHTHSRHATAWAQAGREIPCFGTTHADYFQASVPLTPFLTPEEIQADYEGNTGRAIIRRLAGVDPMHSPGILVAGHAPFCWGRTAEAAAHAAVVLEEIAAMALQTLLANPSAPPIDDSLHEKHFSRKHGSAAYYGQPRF